MSRASSSTTPTRGEVGVPYIIKEESVSHRVGGGFNPTRLWALVTSVLHRGGGVSRAHTPRQCHANSPSPTSMECHKRWQAYRPGGHYYASPPVVTTLHGSDGLHLHRGAPSPTSKPDSLSPPSPS
jgi:hypothetical protein